MNILEQIDHDMKEAMREHIASRVGVLRLLKSSFKNEQIKLGHELNEGEAMKLLQREAKQRRDSITSYTDAKRPELAEAEQMELDVIGGYLPEQIGEAELAKIVDAVIAENGGVEAKMGVVMGKVMTLVAGKADGGSVSKVVRERLG
jgi:uncharacterized protein